MVDHETAVKFLHARKFETERAIALFKAHLVMYHIIKKVKFPVSSVFS